MNKSPSLSKYEIACVTAGVPATGDPVLDQIITQGLRFKTAAEIAAHLSSATPGSMGYIDDICKAAVKLTDKLLAEFRKSSDDK